MKDSRTATLRVVLSTSGLSSDIYYIVFTDIHDSRDLVDMETKLVGNLFRVQRATRCELFRSDDREHFLLKSIKFCSVKDEFSLWRGRKMALAEVVHGIGFSKSQRTEIWQQFLKRWPAEQKQPTESKYARIRRPRYRSRFFDNRVARALVTGPKGRRP